MLFHFEGLKRDTGERIGGNYKHHKIDKVTDFHWWTGLGKAN